MGKFLVTVIRTSWSTRDIEVEAETEDEARNKALDDAPNYEYSDDRVGDYEVEQILPLASTEAQKELMRGRGST